MERGEYRIWDRHDGLKSSSIRAFAEDGSGVIYVATTSGIAIVDPDMNMTRLADSELESAYIRDLRLGTDGLIYGLTQPGDLFTLRDGALETYLSRNDCRVQDVVGILPDPNQPGDLYLGTSGSGVYHGSFKDSFETADITNVAPLAYVERMEYIDGHLWLCADNGIGNIGDEGFRQLDNLPMNNSITHVMTDYEGNLWFTSTRQGAMKVVPNQFSNLYERCGLPEAVVNATCLLGNQLFVATDSGLTVIEDWNKLDSLPLTKAATASGVDLETSDLLEYLNGVRIRSIVRDSKDRLWIASWQKYGLLCYDHGALTSYTVNDGLFSDRVRAVCERSDGAILAANTGGVCVIEDGKVTASYGAEAGIENREILTVTEGMNGDMILGSDGGGIYIIGSEGTRHIGVDEGLGSEVIMRVKRDPYRDIFWIITTNSLAYMDADYQVTTIHNFPYPNNFDLYENSRGDVWVLSGNGIYVLPAEEVLNKPGKLTDDEFEVIKSHASQGYEALKQITIMPKLAIGAEAHHERPDGRGYPNHLKGDQIPRVAQIIAVADCFDAMYSNRPYRNRMNFEKVVSIIQEVSGTQLASDVVDAFMRLVAKGELRAPDDHGGGTTENIDNIHKTQNEEKKDE